MLCNSLSLNGWQKVRNLSVRFNAFKYLLLKSSNMLSLLRVNGNRFNVTTLMLSILSRQLYSWKEILKCVEVTGQFLPLLSRELSLPI